jgi:cation transport ATPase
VCEIALRLSVVPPREQISVKGMHCSACSSAVESALAALPGVQHASVALLTNSAEVCAALSCPRAV